MTGRRAVVGLCMLCALLVSAFAAQGASAVTKGTTAHTCVNAPGTYTPGTNKFEDAHCTKVNNSTGPFGHVEISAGKTTHAILTNTNTSADTKSAEPGFLKATVATIPIKLESTEIHSTKGWLENRTEPNGEHYAIGEGVIHFKGVTVKEPANCKVVQGAKTGEVETTQLVAHTKGQEENMFLKFEPKAGVATAFAEFEIANNGGVCAAAQKVKIVGSVKCRPNGATCIFTHEDGTTQGTLRFGSAAGPKAGLEGKITITAGEGKEEEGKTTNPIAATTVETP